MSAPDTNLSRQKEHHKGPLAGMGLAVGFAVVLFLGWMGWVAYNGTNPSESDPVVAVPEQSMDTGAVTTGN